jgi:glycosyltransferase involved in cell wall biosynthesis
LGTSAEGGKVRRAGIYDPYLDTLGGGERYSMTVAECLTRNGWQVNIFWDDRRIKNKIKEKFGLELKKVGFAPNVFNKSLLEKYRVLKKYDLIFFLSDGSLPFLFGRKNLLHLQLPFQSVNGKSWLNRLKLKKIDDIICNSQFTKKFIDQEYGVVSRVIYPPVAVKDFEPGRKEKMILSVGRFSRLMQAKRQDILIQAFRQMLGLDGGRLLKDWRLVLAGGTEVGKDESFGKLKRMAKGSAVEIIENPSFSELKKLYSRAKIFWLASGFGISEKKHPEKVEHFGITTVEGMASGCVPVVINKGGQREIVTEGQDGLLWKSQKELVKKTLGIIRERVLWRRLSRVAQSRARDFSQERFCREIQEITR